VKSFGCVKHSGLRIPYGSADICMLGVVVKMVINSTHGKSRLSACLHVHNVDTRKGEATHDFALQRQVLISDVLPNARVYRGGQLPS
jgi:hypothetical protein